MSPPSSDYQFPPSDIPAENIATQLAAEMGDAWRRGKCTPAEAFLTRHPDLCSHPPAAVQLIYEEFCLRQEAGLEPTPSDYFRRFPQWQSELQCMFECHDLMQDRPPVPVFPNAGEMLGGFRLAAELDRGALGRVFLATEPSLADRPVVLKLTPCTGEEHLSLARLQHTAIVPLYSVLEFSARNLRALCMPYMGGATLARLLQVMQAQPITRRTGKDILNALDKAQASVPVAVPSSGPARTILPRMTYVDVICSMGVSLADALEFAHERGVVHLDVKPANVLIAADGQPMLLDFHLAREPIRPDSPVPEWLGGTRAYMSPEQIAALDSVRKAKPVALAVDGRSDVYSLGLVMYEALGGLIPPEPGWPFARLNRCNPQISVGLADIIHKCLAKNPANRYPSAAALADDLKRHWSNQPLRGVVNRSLPERWRKWRRRSPLALVTMLMLVTLLVLIVLGFSWVNDRIEAGKTIRAAEQKQTMDTLHGVAEALRFNYDPKDFKNLPDYKKIEARSQKVWRDRQKIKARLSHGTDSEQVERARADMLDTVVLWTDLHVRLATPEKKEETRRYALQVLEETENLFGPSAALYRERRTHAEALNLQDIAEAAARQEREHPLQTAFDYYARGRNRLAEEKLLEAAADFEQAVLLQPNGFWPNFYEGKCAYRRKKYGEAIAAFKACVALAPQRAECYYYRALAYSGLGQPELARQDCRLALERQPTPSLEKRVLELQDRLLTRK